VLRAKVEGQPPLLGSDEDWLERCSYECVWHPSDYLLFEMRGVNLDDVPHHEARIEHKLTEAGRTEEDHGTLSEHAGCKLTVSPASLRPFMVLLTVAIDEGAKYEGISVLRTGDNRGIASLGNLEPCRHAGFERMRWLE